MWANYGDAGSSKREVVTTPDAGTLAGETILFVEDEAFVREVTCEVLRLAGYRVLSRKECGRSGAHVYEARARRCGSAADRRGAAGRDGAGAGRETAARESGAQGVAGNWIWGTDGLEEAMPEECLCEAVLDAKRCCGRCGNCWTSHGDGA